MNRPLKTSVRSQCVAQRSQLVLGLHIVLTFLLFFVIKSMSIDRYLIFSVHMKYWRN